MDNSLMIPVLGFTFALIFFLGIFYILLKKNVFSSKPEAENVEAPKTDDKELDRLYKENKKLKDELESADIKITKMENKIDDLTELNSDLSSQKSQMENNKMKLEDLQDQKEDLLSMVVHDIKNPVSALQNFIELLNSYDLNANEQQEIMEGLFETSEHILHLANDVCKIVKVDSHNFMVEKTTSNINEIIKSVVKRNIGLAEKKRITLNAYYDELLEDSMIDTQKITEVVENYVSNAIKFGPLNSKVDVNTKKDGSSIVVEVKDDGFGLTEADIQRAFEKGAKLSNKPTAGETSTGLGLWITKRICEEHGGRVWVKSKKGLGSTFAFQIPIE